MVDGRANLPVRVDKAWLIHKDVVRLENVASDMLTTAIKLPATGLCKSYSGQKQSAGQDGQPGRMAHFADLPMLSAT